MSTFDYEWRRSSFCASGACVDVRRDGDTIVVRDGKFGDHSIEQTFSLERWPQLLSALANGEDHPDVLLVDDGVFLGRVRPLLFTADEWTAFVAGVKNGEFEIDKLSSGDEAGSGFRGVARSGHAATGAGAIAVPPVPVAANPTRGWYAALRYHLLTTHHNQAAQELADDEARDQHWHEHHGPGGLRNHDLPPQLHDWTALSPAPVAANPCTCPPPTAGGIVGVNRGHLLGCPAGDVGKCPQCGKQTRSYQRGCSWCGFGRPASEPVGECGPGCGEAHQYDEACLLMPPASEPARPVPVAAQPRYILDKDAILELVERYGEACLASDWEQAAGEFDAIRAALTPVPDVEPEPAWGSGPLVEHVTETPADPTPKPEMPYLIGQPASFVDDGDGRATRS